MFAANTNANCQTALPVNVASGERTLSIVVGGAMLGATLLRPRGLSLPLLISGLGFVTRGVTGYCPVNHWLGRGCATDTSELTIVGRHQQMIDVVDEAGDESFPASDPPSYTPVRGVGAPYGG